MAGLRGRETRAQEATEAPETELGDLRDYLTDVKDRRGHVRTPAAQHILNLVIENKISGEEELDAVLELSSAALDAGRDFDERVLYVRIAAALLLNDRASEGFANEFGESLGKIVPSLLAQETPENFLSAVLHALVVAEALCDNEIEATADKLLSTWLLENIRLTKKLTTEENIAATVRALSLITLRAEDEPALAALLRQGVESAGSHPQTAATVVKAIGTAFETFGSTSVLSAQFVETIDEKTMTGNKDAKKEYANTARSVLDLMEKGSIAPVTLTFTLPHSRHSDVRQVEIDSASKLAVLESVRALVGDQYYNSILTSPVLHHYFGLQDESVDRELRAGRRIRSVKQPGDRRADLRERTKGRGDARDRKHADNNDE